MNKLVTPLHAMSAKKRTGRSLMGHTVYATYFLPPYFVRILYFPDNEAKYDAIL